MSEEGLRPDERDRTRPRSGPSSMSEEGLRPDERQMSRAQSRRAAMASAIRRVRVSISSTSPSTQTYS